MKKIFVSDVDNTLVWDEQEQFSLELAKSIKQINEEGSHFVLCSGRPTINLIDKAKELQAKGAFCKYVGGYNGVELYDLEQGKSIRNYSFNKQQVAMIRHHLDELNLNYLYFDENHVRTNIPKHELTIRESGFVKKEIRPNNTNSISQKVLVIIEPERNEQIKAELKQRLINCDVFASAPYYIEIVKQGVNKATVLKEVANIEQISLKNTYAFGDNGNDIELIQTANCGIVVSNGIESVKAVADVVIDDVKTDAVAKYIKQLYSK